MMTNHPYRCVACWGLACIGAACVAIIAWAIFSPARAQMPRDIYPPLSSPTTIEPITPAWRSPGPTIVLPPLPPPRVDYPPLYQPPAPITICTRYGTGTVCQ